MDKDFKEFSILQIGPVKYQRNLVQFKLDGVGSTMRVESDLVLPDNTRKKLVKYFTRQPGVAALDPLYFHSAGACGGWVHTNNHIARVFRDIKLQITGCESIITPSESIAVPQKHSDRLPSLADSEATRIEPHVTRHFNGVLSQGESLTVFTMVLSRGHEESWTVWHRYREFDAIRKVVETELEGSADALSKMPPFPGKSLGTLKGKALDARREALESYIWALVTNMCFGNPNLIDVLCSFLEIPEHSYVEAEVPQAQNLLRQQVVRSISSPGEHTNVQAAAESEEVFPKHILLSKLMGGIRILKHGQYGQPRIRLLRCNPTLTRLYWSDEDEVALPDEVKSIVLSRLVNTFSKLKEPVLITLITHSQFNNSKKCRFIRPCKIRFLWNSCTETTSKAC